MIDYTMKERTYRYFTQEPLYPFGYGLYVAQACIKSFTLPNFTSPSLTFRSYTAFNYSELSMSFTGRDGNVDVSVSVTNTGKMEGDEV